MCVCRLLSLSAFETISAWLRGVCAVFVVVGTKRIRAEKIVTCIRIVLLFFEGSCLIVQKSTDSVVLIGRNLFRYIYIQVLDLDGEIN